ncbi:MAG TPA: TIGR03118 family protein [Gaiellaceae bacterium]|nr:TIGR03118 family protein [Gaiellaceae bacterium]
MHRLVPAALAATLAAALLAVGATSAAPPGNRYKVTPLASDVQGKAPTVDSNLQNTWGLARSDTSPWWIADNGTAAASVYTGSGMRVDIGGNAAQGVPGAPTGAVFSGIPGQFQVGTTASPTTLAPSNFIFDSEDGTISAWRVGSTAALVTVDMSSSKAVFKGLAISNGTSGPRLYATDFAHGSVDVFDGGWNQVKVPGAFVDRRLPKHFAPFGIQTIGNRVFVTYAKQQPGSDDEAHGRGLGIVDAYDLDGKFLARVAQHGQLNAPWGLALAPAGFGRFGGDLLVGNFGDGQINAYREMRHGHFEHRGTLQGARHGKLAIDGLWALELGNAGSNGNPQTLFFTAGIDDEAHGLFGTITPAH